MIERLSAASLEVKEGTFYTLLNRMNADGLLAAQWDLENAKGHPRKFYSLTKAGATFLTLLETEFEQIISIYKKVR